MDLNNKVVVVTGAGRGLGRGIAEALASRGARIACVDLNEDDLRDTVARCERAGGEAKSYLANVAREDEVTALFDGVVADFGALHGKLFQRFLESPAYRARFDLSPVICISVSTSKTYQRTDNRHPVLRVEYVQDDYSLTDEYFGKMGLQVRDFLQDVNPAAYRDILARFDEALRRGLWTPRKNSTHAMLRERQGDMQTTTDGETS